MKGKNILEKLFGMSIFIWWSPHFLVLSILKTNKNLICCYFRVTNSKSIQVNSCQNKHRSFHQLLMPFEKYKLNLQSQESSRSWFLMLYFQFEARKFPSPSAIRWSSPFNIMSSSGYPLLEIVTTDMHPHSIRASAWRRE